MYVHMNLDKEVRNTHWKRGNIFNKCSNLMFACRSMKIDTYLSQGTKLNRKWIKDLKTKPDTLTPTEGKWGVALNSMSQEKTS